MKTIQHFFVTIGLIFVSLCVPLSFVKATNCTVAQSGNVSLSESCTFGGNYDGAADGNIVVGTNVTLTVLAGQVVNVSQGYNYTITASGAKIVIIDSGSIQISSSTICLTDADGDTYASSLNANTQTLETGSCGAGKIARKNAQTQTDCNDSNVSYFAALTCYPDADGDTRYTSTSHSVCAGTTCASVGESASAGTDCNDASASTYATIQCYPNADGDAYYSTTLGSAFCGSTCAAAGQSATVGNDCNDASASTYATIQCYANADNDGVYSKTLGTAFCGSTCAAAGQSATIGTDCCDTDANAKPGQTAWFATARSGCGGFDYDCNSVETHSIGAGGAYGSCVANTSTQSCDMVGGNSGFISDPGCGNVGSYRLGGCCNPGGDCSGTAYPACGLGNAATNNLTQTCH